MEFLHEALSLENLLLFLLLALLAEVLGTVGGFGSSLFFVPVATYFFEFHAALAITAFYHVSSNLAKIALFRKGIDRQILLSIGVPAVIFVIVGAFLSKDVETRLLEICLSAFLIIVSIVLLIFERAQLKPTITNSVAGGVASGFIAGLIGTGGAIRGVTLAAFNLPKDVLIATSAMIDLGVDASRSVVYTLNGYLRSGDLYLIPLLLIISVVGTYLGQRLLRYFSEVVFKRMVLMLVLFTGIYTLVNVLFFHSAGGPQ